MSRNQMHMSRASRLLASGLLAPGLLVAALAGAAGAAADDGPATLDRFGPRLEAIRGTAAAADRVAAADAMARDLEGLDLGRRSGDQAAAVSLLWGEIRSEQGDWDAAADAFDEARRKADDAGLQAAAQFRRIEVLEAAGRDEEAAPLWLRWLRDHGDHALAADARLHLAWNRLRRGEIAAGRGDLAGLAQEHAWITDDPRYRLGVAMGHLLEGDPADALAVVAGHDDEAAAVYVRGLAHRSLGHLLKSAAAFQEVADRFRSSALHDHALLAKANTFLVSGAYRSAAEEFARVVDGASRPAVIAEASLRRAASVLMSGDPVAAEPLLRDVVAAHPRGDVGARAQFLLGELLAGTGDYDGAVLEYNRVLKSYFDHGVAASAQYRLGRCFDALGRAGDATGAYQAVVSGYPLEPEAPAAAYLAGAGLLAMGKPRLAVPYFQLVLDRYADMADGAGALEFASAEHQELVEASLCLLELSYHRSGDLGQLTGAPHLMLRRMPPSASPWRAYALLIDADALAAQAQYDEARANLESLFRDYPAHPAGVAARQLLAWTYAQQGEEDLAVATSEELLAREPGDEDGRLAGTFLNVAHVRFNQGRYSEAADAYEEFLLRYPAHEQKPLALYQAGLCYLRLDRGGDAVDRWEAIVRTAPDIAVAEKAWARAGDLYFQAADYERAKRCYEGLLENFTGSQAAALGLLRIAQCDYNAGSDAEALAGFAELTRRFPSSPFARDAERGIEMALFRLGQGADGVAQLAELVERYPSSAFAADAQFRIASQRYEQEDFAAAAEEFRRVVSQFPGYSAADRAQYLMADALEQSGDVAGATGAFEQFLVFFGDSALRVGVRFRLGSLQFAGEDYFRAATNFASVVESGGDDETVRASRYNLALCRRLLGDDAAAATEFLEYQRDYPADERAADVALQLGDIHAAAGRATEALAAYELAAASAPRAELRGEIWYRLGASREQLDDDDGALAAYAKASAAADRNDPFRLSAVARSAGLYEQAGKYPEALAAYRDLMDNAEDPALVAAATGRVSELEAALQ